MTLLNILLVRITSKSISQHTILVLICMQARSNWTRNILSDTKKHLTTPGSRPKSHNSTQTHSLLSTWLLSRHTVLPFNYILLISGEHFYLAFSYSEVLLDKVYILNSGFLDYINVEKPAYKVVQRISL